MWYFLALPVVTYYVKLPYVHILGARSFLREEPRSDDMRSAKRRERESERQTDRQTDIESERERD